MARYRKDHSQDEARLEELIAEREKQDETAEITQGDPVNTEEEKTFEERYRNLRSYASKKENEYLAQLEREKAEKDALKAQLDEAIKAKIELPKDISSKEEAEAWMKSYPELSKVIRFIAIDMNKDVKEEVTKTKEQLAELEFRKIRQEAFLRLTELQPDWQDIINSSKFKEWLETKSEAYQNAIHRQLNPDAASDIIDVYRAQVLDREVKKPKKENEDRRAAERVVRTTPSGPASEGSEFKYSESYILEMSKKDKNWYAKNEEKIDEAIRQGKFEYDLTGAAR